MIVNQQQQQNKQKQVRKTKGGELMSSIQMRTEPSYQKMDRFATAQDNGKKSNNIQTTDKISLIQVEDILRSDSSSQLNPNDKASAFSSHLQKLNIKNNRYFNHMRGDCRCGICKCQHCKCAVRELQLDHPFNYQSLYKTNFTNMNQNRKQPIEDLRKSTKTAYLSYDQQDSEKLMSKYNEYLLRRNLLTYMGQGKCEMRTTSKDFYVEKKAEDLNKELGCPDRNTLQCGQEPINQNTSYRNEFQKKKKTPNVLFTHEPIQHLHVNHEKVNQRINTESQISYPPPNSQLLPSQLIAENKQFKMINFALHRNKYLKPPIQMHDQMTLSTTQRLAFCKPNMTMNSLTSDQISLQTTQQVLTNAKAQSPLLKKETNKKRSISLVDPYNSEFIKNKNTADSQFQSIPFSNYSGKFITSKQDFFNPKHLEQSCRGWNLQLDDIVRLPRGEYIPAKV